MKLGPAGLFGGTVRGECAAWVAALAAVALLLAFGRYDSRDPDSALYAAMSADLAARPVTEWIAPEWNGHWTLEGLYREHPAGIFVPSALLARLGYPPDQAAYFVNAIYEILTLLLMLALAREFLPRRDSRLLVTLLLLVPIAFTYRIRANQEQPLLVFLLTMLYGIERSRASLKWAALSTGGLAGLFLVKGVFVAVAVASAAAWLVVAQVWWPNRGNGPRPWLALGIGIAALAALYAGYDAAYTGVVGERFFPWYFARQFGVASASSTAHPVAGALYSFAWYAGRIVWFAAPWSAVGALGLWRGVRWLRRPQGSHRMSASRAARMRGAVFCAVVAGTYLVAFSIFQRRAERYIFPVYYLLAAWWVVYGFQLYPWIRRMSWRFTRTLYPYEQVVIWVGSVVLAMIAALLNLPTIKLWR
jgi:4-amino-4-deoxy-L-arabinose transferase-like glycosyltransferase